MAKYVLVSDTSLTSSFRNFPLLPFLPAAPSGLIFPPIYHFLKGKTEPALPNGEASFSSYSIRKIEAALLALGVPRGDVAVPHDDHIEKFITGDTDVIAVSTMDPLGFSPLAMSFSLLFDQPGKSWSRVEWERLIARLNRARAGKKAKLVIGGPGIWEFTIAPELLDTQNIDYAIQGETEDIIRSLLEQISRGSLDPGMFAEGYVTFDDCFHRAFTPHSKFITRKPGLPKGAPALEEIPTIVRPSMLGIIEAMRGCGVGCDFCEVTLRPLRYYPVQKVVDEVKVNAAAGYGSVWLHSDEIFGYKRTNAKFEPNQEAMEELFSAIMAVPGVKAMNPTHGRISIPAGYPQLIERLSSILRAGPGNWIGLQVGVETGSEALARKHMPNKTLPLKIGVDGTWEEIVMKGTYNLNKYFWRPAFTIQVGQADETREDNWDTVALINKLSNSEVEGRPFEFTITPMQNVPLGMIKSRGKGINLLDESQLAVYYASYRHLAKMVSRNTRLESKGNVIARTGIYSAISLGAWGMLKIVEGIARKKGVDIEKAKTYGLEANRTAIKISA